MSLLRTRYQGVHGTRDECRDSRFGIVKEEGSGVRWTVVEILLLGVRGNRDLTRRSNRQRTEWRETETLRTEDRGKIGTSQD